MNMYKVQEVKWKKQFVSLEDIQRANNEYKLTDVEQREVNEKKAE
jgi:hypothetical protein